MGVWWWGPRRRRPQIRNFIIENEVPDLGHGRVGCWVPCLDEVVGFVFGFILLVLYVGGSGGGGPQQLYRSGSGSSESSSIHCSI